MPNEEFDMLGEDDLALLSKRFERLYMLEERSEELGHVLQMREAQAHYHRVLEGYGDQARAQEPSKDRPQAPLEEQL
jgi:hypothetical protein